VFQLLELKSEDENLRIYEFRPTWQLDML
jgi:hypothetical protein